MSICPFCHPYLDPSQRIVADNDTCYFLMHDHEQDLLVDFGVIVPKQHRATTFKLTPKEWSDTYTLLHDAKSFLEKTYDSDSYTLGWNVDTASNQSVPYAHSHIIPRYASGPQRLTSRHWVK